MGVVTTSTLPAPVQENFNERILSTPVPNYIYHTAAVRFRNPGESGLTARFRRYNPIGAATVPLSPAGITPPSTNFTAVDIDATVNFYGTWIEINETVTLGNQDPSQLQVQTIN